jgi:hypothetical protein
MSLLRLLTAGKSLVGLRDTPNSYRLPRQRLLPQFGSARNPFVSNARADAGQAKESSAKAGGGTRASTASAEIQGPGGMATAVLEAGRQDRAASTSASSHSPIKVSWRRATALAKPWKERMSALFGGGRGRSAKPVIPRFTKQPVQGELLLDNVRVVRNDLSDADLEVIPARTLAARTRPALALEREGAHRVAGRRWGRIANRIFGAGKA